MEPERPPRLESVQSDPLTGAKVRTYRLVNQLVLPGFGSILAGRRVGWAQIVLALTGFAFTVGWFISFVQEWARLGDFPPDGGPHFRMGLSGIGLFVLAWLWAMFTGLHIQRAAPTTNT